MKNKKKLIIFMLVAIMVLSLCVTALVGCSDAPKGYKKIKSDDFSLSSVLSDPLYNTVMENGLDNLKFGTQLQVNTKYGKTENKYLIKLDAQLAFNIKDNNTNIFSLQVLDNAADNANLLSIYYKESPNNMASIGDDPSVVGEGNVYVAVGNGANAKYFCLNGLSIKSVLRTQYITQEDASGEPVKVHPSIDKEGAEELGDSIVEALDKAISLINTISGACTIFESKGADSYIIRLDLAKVLKNFDDVIQGVAEEYGPMIKQMGLDLDLGQLSQILPALTADFTFNLANVEKGAENAYENATIAGVGVKLNAKKKDFQIKKTDGNDFIRINIAKDFTADVMFNFAFGDEVDVPANIQVGTQNDYKNVINAINFTAKGELNLKKGINVAFAINGKPNDIEIPSGEYDINLAADLDPTKLIGMQFNVSKENMMNDILELAEDLMSNVVKKLKIELVSKTDSEKRILIDMYMENDELLIDADFSLIGGSMGKLLSGLKFNGVNIQNAISSIRNVLSMFTADSDTSSGADDSMAEIINVIKGIVNNMSIVANAGKLTIEMNNQSVAQNKEYDKDGETVVKDNGDTLLDAKVEADSTGLNITAALKNVIINAAATTINANVTVNSSGVTITAATTESIKISENEDGTINGIDVDLVLKLTEFKYGAAK